MENYFGSTCFENFPNTFLMDKIMFRYFLVFSSTSIKFFFSDTFFLSKLSLYNHQTMDQVGQSRSATLSTWHHQAMSEHNITIYGLPCHQCATSACPQHQQPMSSSCQVNMSHIVKYHVDRLYIFMYNAINVPRQYMPYQWDTTCLCVLAVGPANLTVLVVRNMEYP